MLWLISFEVGILSVSLQKVIEEETSLFWKMTLIHEDLGSKNSLNDVVDILGHLQDLNFISSPSSAHLEITENPLDEVIDSLKHIGETIEVKESDTSIQVSDTIDNLVDIYNNNQELHLIEEEENRNVFADVVRLFGELFRSMAGLETSDKDFYLTYIDIVIMILFILSFFFLFFMIYVTITYCRRKIRTRKINCQSSEYSQEYDSGSGSSSGDCSVSWISINSSNISSTGYSDLPSPDVIQMPPQEKRFLMESERRSWYKTEEVSPSILV